jgi:hypothetical protein
MGFDIQHTDVFGRGQHFLVEGDASIVYYCAIKSKIKTTGRRLVAEPALGCGPFEVAFLLVLPMKGSQTPKLQTLKHPGKASSEKPVRPRASCR